MDIHLIAETVQWIVLRKPAGWLTIPGRAPGVPILSEIAQGRFGRLWTVHRLDLETSGVVLFARSAEAHRQVNAWFQAHQVKKSYDFLAEGHPVAPALRLNKPVRGLPSLTQITVQERFEREGRGVFLGRAVPLTGRRHQIRIHLSGEGFPILGDQRYGGGSEWVGRTALHARRLELPSGEFFEAPWPEDFSAWVETLRGGAMS